MAGLFFITLPIHIFNFDSTLVSLLEMFIHILAIAGAYLCKRLTIKHAYQYIFSLLILTGAYVVSTTGYDMWLNYLNFGTLTGEVKSEKLTSPIYFKTANGDISNADLKKDLVLLDFWSSSCGICFKSFPNLQKLYDTYSEKIEIYSVFVATRQGDNYVTGDSILKARGYTFPVLFVEQSASALSQLKITLYPTVILLNKKGDVLFRGNLENAEKYIKDKL